MNKLRRQSRRWDPRKRLAFWRSLQLGDPALLAAQVGNADTAMLISGIGQWEYDFKRAVFRFNDTYFRLHGTTAAEMGGYEMSAEDFSRRLIHPEDAHQIGRAIQRALASTTGAYEEDGFTRILHADGSFRWARVWFRVEKDEEGRAVKMLGVNQDIHEQKLTEIALRESEARYRALVAALPDIVFLCGCDGTFLEVHTQAPDKLYLPPQEFIGRSIDAVLPPDIARLFADAFARANESGREQVIEYALPVYGGDHFYEARVIPCYSDVTMVLVRDIQERKQIDLALQMATAEAQRGFALIQGLLAAIPLPVFYKDLQGRFVGCNDAYLKMVNLRAEQIISKTPAEVWPNSTGALFAQKDADLLREGGKQIYEHISPDTDGQPRDVINFKTVFLDENGAVAGTVGAIVDITERKRAEAEVIRLNAELEQRVRERTAQLEEANRELEAFAYSISHDMRAPLRAVDGFSKILHDDYADTLDESGRSNLRRIRAAAQRMGTIIDGMMDLSNLSRVGLRAAEVDLSARAEEILRGLAAAEPARQVEWSVAPGCVVLADPGLMEILLDNLLGNAWKFTNQKPATRIEFGCEEQAGEQVYFVRDNGAGFDMAYAGKLFGVFQRLHDIRQFPGTGIGLATVRRVIMRHGGRIWVDARPGEGAVFYFTLGRPAA